MEVPPEHQRVSYKIMSILTQHSELFSIHQTFLFSKTKSDTRSTLILTANWILQRCLPEVGPSSYAAWMAACYSQCLPVWPVAVRFRQLRRRKTTPCCWYPRWSRGPGPVQNIRDSGVRFRELTAPLGRVPVEHHSDHSRTRPDDFCGTVASGDGILRRQPACQLPGTMNYSDVIAERSASFVEQIVRVRWKRLVAVRPFWCWILYS